MLSTHRRPSAAAAKMIDFTRDCTFQPEPLCGCWQVEEPLPCADPPHTMNPARRVVASSHRLCGSLIVNRKKTVMIVNTGWKETPKPCFSLRRTQLCPY